MIIWGDFGEPSRKAKFSAVALFIVIVALLMFAPSAFAQNQAASVELAKAAMHDVDKFVEAALKCAGLPTVKAQNSCLKVIDRAAKRSEKVANEVADSIQKNRWPTFVSPYGSNGAYAPGFIPGGGPGGLTLCVPGKGCNTQY